MGLNYYTAREILGCRRDGRLGEVLTIGRLQQYLLPAQIDRLAREHGLGDGPWVTQRFGEFADDFFRAAGADRLVSLDASAYQGAEIVRDLNEPVTDMRCRYDVCVDGGSLEHIFRPDRALANEMGMLRPGGQLIIWTPANNLCGHGFYQFSPEFFFSALTADSGFALREVLLVECVYPQVSLITPRRAFHVRSPRELRRRVGVLSRRPLMLLVSATKLSHVEQPFARVPQQSDYVNEWERAVPEATTGRLVSSAAGLARRTPAGAALVNHVIGLGERRRFSLRNRRSFVPER